MRRPLSLLVVLAALVASTAALAAPAGWRFVASANDSSDYFASASLTKKVNRGRAARIT